MKVKEGDKTKAGITGLRAKAQAGKRGGRGEWGESEAWPWAGFVDGLLGKTDGATEKVQNALVGRPGYTAGWASGGGHDAGA